MTKSSSVKKLPLFSSPLVEVGGVAASNDLVGDVRVGLDNDEVSILLALFLLILCVL
jgi:hypothetical protein